MKGKKFIDSYLQKRRILNYLLLPISLVFSLILIIRRTLYKTILPQFQANIAVISVGNITVGGTGKTPFTIWLAETLTGMGYKVAVSHSGYKSDLENSVSLISNTLQMLPDAELAGDEAWLFSNRLPGIPVVVGKNRRKAIKLLQTTFPELDCVILDDSFQHLKVWHDLDFIIFNSYVKFGNSFVLPAGMLREPLFTLNDCDFIILNGAGRSDIESGFKNALDMYKKEIFTGYYDILCLYDFNGDSIPSEILAGKEVLLLTGIGSPSGFADSVNMMQVNVAGRLHLPDHYDYSDEPVRKKILEEKNRINADWIVTTEKDFAKLRKFPEFKDNLLILKIGFKMDSDEDKLIVEISRRIDNKRQNR